MKTPTPLQNRILKFLRDFHSTEDRLPSTREIATAMEIKNQNAIQGVLLSLAKKGFIEHRTNPRQSTRNWWRFARGIQDSAVSDDAKHQKRM